MRQDFAGIEAEASRVAERSRHFHPVGSADACAVRLASIVDEFEIELPPQFLSVRPSARAIHIDARERLLVLRGVRCAGALPEKLRSAGKLMLPVAGSISTNFGRAPVCLTDAVAMKVIGTVITSSPGPTPSASSAMRSASVPFATATTALHVEKFGEFTLEAFDLMATDVCGG